MSRRAAQIEDEARRRALLMGPFGLGRPLGGGGVAPAADLLIDDCESAWTGVTGVVRIVSDTPTAGGSGYAVNDIVDVITGGFGAQVQVRTVDGGGAVTALNDAGGSVYAGGFGTYTTGAGKATSGGSGTGLTVNISVLRNVVASVDAVDFVVGARSMKAVVSASSVCGRTLFAYRAISPGDLSAYTKLRFRYKNNVALPDDTQFRVCLCSDAVGRVIVDEFKVPATPGTGAWIQAEVTRTGGGPLGANIASIMLGTGAGVFALVAAPPTMNLDDIWAIA